MNKIATPISSERAGDGPPAPGLTIAGLGPWPVVRAGAAGRMLFLYSHSVG